MNWRNQTLILASSSPRRTELFRQAGIPFRNVPGDVVEVNHKKLSPADYAKELSRLKAEDGLKKANSDLIYTFGFVVGADTIVVLNGKILEKPKDEKDAKRMLLLLSGKTHTVMTGVTILHHPSRKAKSFVETTKVTFRKLKSDEIEEYILSREPMDKAGAYGAQGNGAKFINRVQGCFYNVVGFPLARFFDEMDRWKI